MLLASRGGVVDAPYDHGILHRPAAEQRRGYAGSGGQRTPRLVAFDTRYLECIKQLHTWYFFVVVCFREPREPVDAVRSINRHGTVLEEGGQYRKTECWTYSSESLVSFFL